MIIKMQ